MLRVSSYRSVAVFLGVGLIASTAFGATSDPYTTTTSEPTCTNPASARVVLVGCTLGNNWSGFPNVLMPDYTGTQWWDRLDVTLPLYVTWILDTNVGGTPVPVSPPKPITDYASDWFVYNEFTVAELHQDLDLEYTACLAGNSGSRTSTAASATKR